MLTCLLYLVWPWVVLAFNPFEFSCGPRYRRDIDWRILRKRFWSVLQGDINLPTDKFLDGKHNAFGIWYGNQKFEFHESDWANCPLAVSSIKMIHQALMIDAGFLSINDVNFFTTDVSYTNLADKIDESTKSWYAHMGRMPLITILSSGWPMFGITHTFATAALSRLRLLDNNPDAQNLLKELVHDDINNACIADENEIIQEREHFKEGSFLISIRTVPSSYVHWQKIEFECVPLYMLVLLRNAVDVAGGCKWNKESNDKLEERRKAWGCFLAQSELIWKAGQAMHAQLFVLEKLQKRSYSLLSAHLLPLWKVLDELQTLQRKEYFVSCNTNNNTDLVCPACDHPSQMEWHWEAGAINLVMEHISYLVLQNTRTTTITNTNNQAKTVTTLCDENYPLHFHPACKYLENSDPTSLPYSRMLANVHNSIHTKHEHTIANTRMNYKEAYVTLLCDEAIYELDDRQRDVSAARTLATYVESIRTLVYSVRKHEITKRPFLVLVIQELPMHIKDYLEQACGVEVVLLPSLKSMGVHIQEVSVFDMRPAMWARLQLVGLEEYNALVYLDSDQIITSSLDGLFNMLQEKHNVRFAAPVGFPHFSELNIGVLAIKPSKIWLGRMIDSLMNQEFMIPEHIPAQDQEWWTTFFYHHLSFGGVAEFDSSTTTNSFLPEEIEKSQELFCGLPVEYNFCATQHCASQIANHKNLQIEIVKASIRGMPLNTPDMSLNMRVIHWPGVGRKPWSRYHPIARSGFDELWWRYYNEACENSTIPCRFHCLPGE